MRVVLLLVAGLVLFFLLRMVETAAGAAAIACLSVVWAALWIRVSALEKAWDQQRVAEATKRITKRWD